MMPVHIVRPLGKHEFIPAYSTDVLLQGVCHIVSRPEPEPEQHKLERISRFISVLDKGHEAGREARAAKSRAKFEQNKSAIYALLAEGRGIKHISIKFHIGAKALERYVAWDSGRKRGNQTQRARSRAGFEQYKSEIYAMLAEKRGVWTVAETFGFGGRQLKRYLEESK